MTCFRILNTNYAFGDALANRILSSEDADFPATNLDDIYRRSKVWRTAGYFNIQSGSNTIVFRETIGVDLTATVTVDEYASIDAVALAIKTALEAAGASTYSVGRDATTKRWEITSDGSGGGGIFQLRWSQATAMADILGYAASDLTGALVYEADVLRNHTEEFIIWDFGVPLNPTDFCLAGLRTEFLKISPSATVKIQGNDTNNWTSPQFEQTLTVDDKVLYHHNADGFDSSPRRFWRLYIQDKTNSYGYVEASLAFIGLSQDLDRGCVRFPFRTESIDPSVTTFSEGGQSYSDRRNKAQRINADWNGLTKQDFQELYEIFEEKGITEPFFIAADPSAAFSTAKEYWVRYVKFERDVAAELVSPNNYAMSMVFREQI